MSRARIAVAALSLSAAALVGIATHEGYRGDAYIPVPGDVPTIGFGETKGVKLGQKTTPERALVQLLESAESHAEGIKKCIKVPLHAYEFSAYSSLAYNIGAGAFCSSTLVKKLNQGDYSAACDQILRWDYSGGKRVRGLTIRRQQEHKQCLGES
jgi:lysozyme